MMWDDFKTWLQDWFTDWIVETLVDSVKWLIEISFQLYDKFLTAILAALNAIELPAAWTSFDPWAGMAGQCLYLLGQFRIVEVLAIISTAWAIRWILNTIPFVRI